MRTDSRGLPVRRSFLGTNELFFDAEAIIAKRERERNKHKKKGLGWNAKNKTCFTNTV